MAVRIVVTNIRYEDRPMVNVKRSALLDLDIQSFDGRINAIDAALENRKNSFRRCSVTLCREHILRLHG